MSFKSFAYGALLAAGLGIVSMPAAAQNGLGEAPANLPPESFTGAQFVDNNGCIFVRAGFDGATTWVPRVTRSRQQICGQSPTFGTATAAAPVRSPAPVAAAPTPTPAPAPAAQARPATPATAAAPAPRPVAAAPRPALQTASRPQPEPRVVRAPASKPQAAEPPRVIRRVPAVAPVAPVVQGQRLQRLDAETCRYGWVYKEVNGIRTAMNCVPVSDVQGSLGARIPETAGRRVLVSSVDALPGHTRIVPRHVYENRVQLNGAVPHGYRPAWEDDRLNPHRAWQTVDGYYDTQQVWTNTVPRRLVTEPRTAWQPRHRIKDPVIAYRVTGERHQSRSTRTLSSRSDAGRAPVVSSRSAPVAPAARYVEIGAFTTPAGAREAAGRLTAAGLPVRLGRYKDMTRVLVGPYSGPAALQAALSRVHGTGYVQARLR